MTEEERIAENRKLITEYPFLNPWNFFAGEPISNDGKYTELDLMPKGWRTAFGIQLCQDLKEALIEDNDLETWHIVQMKEKYGMLRIEDNGTKIGSRVPDILRKYEQLSERICIECGKPATKITLGWISPYCDKCCPRGKHMPIEQYFTEGSNG